MFFTSSAIKLAVELSIAVVCALHTVSTLPFNGNAVAS